VHIRHDADQPHVSVVYEGTYEDEGELVVEILPR
jgi:hypothetical protein